MIYSIKQNSARLHGTLIFVLAMITQSFVQALLAVNVYSSLHYYTVLALYEPFTMHTTIDVHLIAGVSTSLTNQILT